MKLDNPLSRDFLLQFPVDAARALEQVAAVDVAAFCSELPAETVAPVLSAMLPELSARCLDEMQSIPAAALLMEMPASRAAAVFGLLPAAKQVALSALLSDKSRNRIRHLLDYAPLFAGDLMEPVVNMLTEDLTVSEALRRMKRLRHAAGSEVYVIDSAHRLLGVIELGRLLTSSYQARLGEIMNHKTQSVSAHANTEQLLAHPGWATLYRLPVVERDNTLVGVLDYRRLQDATSEREVTSYVPMQNLLSLAGLYWLTLAQLLDSLLGKAGPGKGGKQ